MRKIRKLRFVVSLLYRRLEKISATRYISADEIQLIEQRMPSYTAGVWRLCRETGVRISDAVCARTSDFDDKNRYHYTAHKTGKKGMATVSSDFVRRYVKPLKGDRYVFLSPYKRGKHVTRQTVYNHVKKACKLLKIDPAGISPHSTRKHFAAELYHSKGLGAVMKALQHGDAATTMLYALSDDPLPELLKKVKRLEKIVEMLSDAVFGDDRYTITEKGREHLKSDKLDL